MVLGKDTGVLGVSAGVIAVFGSATSSLWTVLSSLVGASGKAAEACSALLLAVPPEPLVCKETEPPVCLDVTVVAAVFFVGLAVGIAHGVGRGLPFVRASRRLSAADCPPLPPPPTYRRSLSSAPDFDCGELPVIDGSEL